MDILKRNGYVLNRSFFDADNSACGYTLPCLYDKIVSGNEILHHTVVAAVWYYICGGWDDDTYRSEYYVNDNKYVIKENISRNIEKITIGKIPIGVRKIDKIHTNVGESITVLYNPNKPKMAYIKGNMFKEDLS